MTETGLTISVNARQRNAFWEQRSDFLQGMKIYNNEKKHALEDKEVKNVNWKEDEYRIMSSVKSIMLALKNKIQMVRVQYPEESNQRPYRDIVGLISSSSKNKTLFLSL